ncbi:glutamate racemase [Acetobacter vaccinii]|uniref:Glutamate racemase n=1 Tax=Acetobacter vaccinii TaxID=2592655 RepID=A0A5C1YPZ6_9PROT|nr:aspartate/glutamate racemase family protein [Acetobacter vaccinii]QEO18436.1 glutamate racemase [Acetobacter vaccinii]
MQLSGVMQPPAHRILAFDSGIGGLGIVRALRAMAPDVDIDYLADTAVFPYGEQDDTVLIARIVSLLSDAIARLRPQAVVVACNTASTLALDALRAACPTTPFIGCVPPIRWAARLSHTHVIGLLATRATVRRPYLTRLHTQYAPDCTLIAHAAPGLAELAERVFRGQPVPDADFEQELQGLFAHPDAARMDMVGIGCTHYTFVLDRLRALSPTSITWLDPADAVARQTCTILQECPPASTMRLEPPQAWFTARPQGASTLLARLPSYGFDTMALWSEKTFCPQPIAAAAP